MINKILRTYKYSLYPKIAHLRGTTRLLKAIEKMVFYKMQEDLPAEEGLEDMEWQNLVILDGCRYDVYTEVFGETGSRISRGSMSQEFIERNFSNNTFEDTIVITANPFYNEEWFQDLTGKELDEVFFEVFHTYQTDWNGEQNTVLPEDLISNVETAQKLFPEKRKLIHFMQPHYPFIGYNFGDKGFNFARRGDQGKNIEHSVWGKVMAGEVNHDEAYEGYKSNLELLDDKLSELSEILSGPTIVTADHGNLLGEGGLYGHPKGLRTEGLRKVPKDDLERFSK